MGQQAPKASQCCLRQWGSRSRGDKTHAHRLTGKCRGLGVGLGVGLGGGGGGWGSGHVSVGRVWCGKVRGGMGWGVGWGWQPVEARMSDWEESSLKTPVFCTAGRHPRTCLTTVLLSPSFSNSSGSSRAAWAQMLPRTLSITTWKGGKWWWRRTSFGACRWAHWRVYNVQGPSSSHLHSF
jgi:hypothetical protein